MQGYCIEKRHRADFFKILNVSTNSACLLRVRIEVKIPEALKISINTPVP